MAAAAFGSGRDGRLRIFEETREAYKFRSDVVHGREVAARGGPCQNAERILRQSIHFWLQQPRLMEHPEQLDELLVRGQ
jgi:hypothetical protein